MIDEEKSEPYGPDFFILCLLKLFFTTPLKTTWPHLSEMGLMPNNVF